MTTTTTSAYLDAALAYVNGDSPIGEPMRVVPLHPGTKKAAIKWGDGAAPSTPEQVTRVWSRFPHCPVAVILNPSRIVVLDVEGEGHHHDREGVLESIHTTYGTLPPTLSASTSGGGVHFYFRLPEGVSLAALEQEPGGKSAGFEFRKGSETTNGHIAGVPALMDGDEMDGRAWLDLLPIAELPKSFWPDPRAKASTPKPPTTEQQIGEGGRHAYLVRIGGASVRQGATEPELLDSLRSSNPHRCNPPKDDADLVSLAADLVKRYPPAPLEWPEATALRPEPMPPMPLDGVPGVVRDHVEAIAAGHQLPVDLALLCCLGALATCCQGLAYMQMGPGWTEELSLFTMAVLPSAERKSAAIREAVAPIEHYERDWAERVAEQVHGDREIHKALQMRVDEAVKAVAKAQGADEHVARADLRDALSDLAEHVPMVTPRLLADDVTPEQLSRVLADHGRLGIISAEGGIIETLAGRYNKGVANLDAALKAYGGETIRIDRRGSDPVHVIRPLLTLSLAVQPDVIEQAAGNRALMGRGMIPRFLISVPQSLAGTRSMDSHGVPPGVEAAWARALYTLIAHAEAGGFVTLATLRPSDAISLDTDAEKVMRHFREQIEQGLAPGDGRYSSIGAFAGKAAGLAGRIAGVLYLAEHGPSGIGGKVGKEITYAATAIVEHHLAHVLRMVHEAGIDDEAVRDARTILAWADNTGRQTFTGRQALTGARKRSGGPDTAQRIHDAMVVLDERGYARADGGGGGFHATSGTTFEINPEAPR